MNTDSSLVDSSVAIQHFFDSAKASNMGKIYKIIRLLTDTNGVSASDIAAATSLNNSLVSPDTVESTYQSVFNVMICMDNAGGQYIPSNPTQLATLHTIAPLCPLEYGEGVFFARALLSQIDHHRWTNACDEEGDGGGDGGGDDDGHKPQKNTTQNNDSIMQGLTAKVYPNPANTMLNVELYVKQGQTATICLYNSIGEMVRCETISNGLTTISSSDLASGIYYYRITDENNMLIKADNIMIMH